MSAAATPQRNKHATKHFHATHHPVMRLIEPGETWGWCYLDRTMLDLWLIPAGYGATARARIEILIEKSSQT